MKRILLLFLVLALLLPTVLLTSCNGKKPNETESSSVTTEASQAIETETTVADVIGFDKQNYQTEFKILLNQNAASDFSVDELAEDALSKSIYNRNLACEEYLGLILDFEQKPGNWNSGLADTIRDLIFSNACDYDMVIMGLNTGIIGGYINIYQNILEMEYIHPNHSWWIQDLIDQNSINGQLYFLGGDICRSLYSSIGCVFTNLDVAANFQLGVDFYDLVNEGDWTMEEFFNLFKRVSADDGDGVFDRTKDTFGWGDCNIGVRLMWSCADIHLIERQSDGTFALRPSLDDRIIRFVESMKSACDEPTHSYFAPADAPSMIDAFVGNRLLFITAMLAHAGTIKASGIQSKFAFLPMPKYDASQEDYISTSMPAYNAVYFPVSIASPERSAQVAEYMGWYGQKNVIPAYYDETLKYRQNDDEANIEMIELIRQKLRITPNESYGVIGGLDSIMYLTQADLVNTSETGFYTTPTSVWKQKYPTIADTINTYILQYFQ